MKQEKSVGDAPHAVERAHVSLYREDADLPRIRQYRIAQTAILQCTDRPDGTAGHPWATPQERNG